VDRPAGAILVEPCGAVVRASPRWMKPAAHWEGGQPQEFVAYDRYMARQVL
jgi:hypothetical protein